MTRIILPTGVVSQEEKDLKVADEEERQRRDAVSDNLWATNKALMRKQLRARHRSFRFYLLSDGHVTEIAQLESHAREKGIPLPILMKKVGAKAVSEKVAQQAYRQTNPVLVQLDRQPLPSQRAGIQHSSGPAILGPDGAPLSRR